MGNHTPGPWESRGTRIYALGCRIPIAQMETGPPIKDPDANAQVMASALSMADEIARLKDDVSHYKQLVDYAYIEGFKAGMHTVWQVEKDEYCRKVLAKNFPHAQQYEDVNEIDWTTLAPIDLLCGGYPCQPFSLAGKRQGAEDDRHLWPRMREAIQALRPAWVIGENVAGHISLGLDSVLSDLEGEGYTTRPFVIPACAAGAMHQRDRVFVVAHTNRQRLEGQHREGVEAWNVCRVHCLPGAQSPAHKISTPTRFRDGNRVPHRVDRTRALGNAVVPQVAYQIGLAIMAANTAAHCGC